MSVVELVKKAQDTALKLVEITGGEPLLQSETPLLIDSLLEKGFKVLIETNGSIDIRPFNREAVFIVDLKSPSSGMSAHNDLTNISALKASDEVKFVLSDRDDYLWAADLIGRYRLIERCHVLLSPAVDTLQAETLASWIIQDALNVRLNLQLHKYIYGAHRRMV